MLKTKLYLLTFLMVPLFTNGICAPKVKANNIEPLHKTTSDTKNTDFLKIPLVEMKPLNLNARPVSQQAAITASISQYQENGKADVILAGNNRILFPYGLAEATLTCASLRVCSIELEAGEVIIAKPFLGDSLRWWISYTQSGDERPTPHIIVKPLVNEPIETNMIIMTDKHKYYIRLKSVTDGPFTPMIGFYYPQEPQKTDDATLNTSDNLQKIKKKESYRSVDIDNLNFNYLLQGKKRPWYPEKVYDDGQKVYIQLPLRAKFYETPVVFVVGEDGKYELVNYRLKSSKEGKLYFVVDRLFYRAVLVLSQEGVKEQRIHIVRMRD